MSSEENDDKAKATNAILDMLREAGVSTESLEDTKHAFWDTQVQYSPVMEYLFILDLFRS
jgi:hypothetical protein